MDYSRYLSILDDDDEVIAAMNCMECEEVPKEGAFFRIRWQSEYLRDLAEKENSFIAEYRVGPKEFDILHRLFEESLTVNEKMADLAMSKSKSGRISTASRLGIALIMLGGGRRTEAMRTHGVAKPTVYKILHSVCKMINEHPALAIESNLDLLTLQRRAAEFKSKSTPGLFDYCVGAIDGLAIRIATPSLKESMQPVAYYSGSKKYYCLNFQGVCDANRQFIGVSCKYVGSTNDVDAFDLSHLKELFESMPFPFHLLGDGSYTLTEVMMIPYLGVNLHIHFPSKDSFNFWHSQLRINIECTFAMFIQRWGIFWKALEFDLKNVFAIIHTCVRLHNFCVQRRMPINDAVYQAPEIALCDENGVLVNDLWRVGPHEDWKRNNVGSSLRERITRVIEERQLYHARNINYNNN